MYFPGLSGSRKTFLGSGLPLCCHFSVETAFQLVDLHEQQTMKPAPFLMILMITAEPKAGDFSLVGISLREELVDCLFPRPKLPLRQKMN
jgi:hypothetical protein